MQTNTRCPSGSADCSRDFAPLPIGHCSRDFAPLLSGPSPRCSALRLLPPSVGTVAPLARRDGCPPRS
eukprot:2391259-Prymnesium_polylepis.1